MANSHVSISCAYDQCQADIATALTNKYSEGVTIHYKTINDLIFSCDAISSKVIRIRVAGRSSTISAYYGDAWTSGTTITNAVTFLTTVSSLGVPASMNMVLGTSFILLNCLTTNEGTRSELIIVGKATNGDSAVDICSHDEIDCVFLDIQMPGKDGLTVLQDIRAFKPQMKVMMITGKDDVALRDKAKLAGALDYITKPLDLGELNEKIEKHILSV